MGSSIMRKSACDASISLKRHSFDFSSGELSHFAVRVVEPEISEEFLDFLHKFRFVFVVTV